MSAPDEKITSPNKGFEDPTFANIQKPGESLDASLVTEKTDGNKAAVNPAQIKKPTQVKPELKKPAG
jgi:hypothetical protein